LGFFFH